MRIGVILKTQLKSNSEQLNQLISKELFNNDDKIYNMVINSAF